jgi:hypothetical protein
MGGGLLQLVAYGAQDVYLTGNPQITFFKVVYRRHTNFAIEAIVQTPTGGNTFGSRASFQITRNGDLIHRVYFYCKIKASDTATVALVPNFGQKLLKTVELEIGGQRIDKHYSEWLYIWNELSLPVGKREGYNTMVGANPRNICTKLNMGQSYELYVPLEFWFCRNVGLALPLIALQYHEVKINIEYESESNMKDYTSTNFTYDEELTAGGVASVNITTAGTGYTAVPTVTFTGGGGSGATAVPVLTGGSISAINITNIGTGYTSAPTFNFAGGGTGTGLALTAVLGGANNSNAKFSTAAAGQISLTSPTLWVDYIFLDTDERRRFAQLSHEYLIEQLQFTGTESITKGDSMKSIRMNFNHPCKELIWTVRNSEGSGIYWNNFSSCAPTIASSSIVINDALDSTNPITNCKIMLNGNDRMAPRSGEYFGIVQPYQHHEITPDKFHEGINVYSFAIKPEEHQPSGTLNMSRIDTATLSVASSITGNISVYAVNYNVLRILSGMGGLAYSN